MTLLCYDHHENIKQIEIESDSEGSSSSSEAGSDVEGEGDFEDDHEIIDQSSTPVGSDVVKWTLGLPIKYLRGNLKFVFAALVVGVALFIGVYILT